MRLLTLSSLIVALPCLAFNDDPDKYTGFNIELLKIGTVTSQELHNYNHQAKPSFGWGARLGYEWDGYNAVRYSISKVDNDIDGLDFKRYGTDYQIDWALGKTFDIFTNKLSLKPYGFAGWHWGKTEKLNEVNKYSAFSYGLGIRFNVFEGIILGAEWNKTKVAGEKLDSILISAGFKF